MLAFASAITRRDLYARCAGKGIALVREPSTEVLELDSTVTLSVAYNQLLDRAAALGDDLEGLVLLHQDTEITSPDFCARMREVLADETVAIAGCAGAVGVRGIAWWEGSVTLASFTHRYEGHGGGELPAFSWTWDGAPPYAKLGEVETLDGFLLALSPWAVKNLRFDESLGEIHGYDLDLCLQAREAGKRVVTADVRAIHHHELHAFSDQESWKAAHVAVARKWAHRLDQPSGTWRERALRAEAEAATVRLSDAVEGLKADAQRHDLEREIALTTGSVSWKLAAPLRAWAERADGARA